MEAVKDHYDSFLGPVYSWTLGDFSSAARRNADLFASIPLSPGSKASAVDLGCGPGCQSVPLAQLGYDVVAIDFCRELLDELEARASGLRIRTVCDDLLNFREHMSDAADVIVCMGDTLVHLPDPGAVEAVLDDVCKALKPGGRFIYAIRDYVSSEPVGAQRFIPVRSDDEQIFTCFLDYAEDKVHVHDILHRKTDGGWQMTISDYLKLRLDSRAIDQRLERNGLVLQLQSNAAGMLTRVAQKPA